jgi:porin
LLGISGGTFFAQYFYRGGPHGSDDIGDIQGYDNIDARHLSQVEELWYEQKLIHNRLRLKLGQVDANAEFENLPASAEFINSSAAFSPTLLEFPTYPKPAVSVNLFAYPTDWFYCGTGIYTENLRNLSMTRFQRPYLIGECGFSRPSIGPLGAGRLALGVWHGTAALCRFDGGRQTGTSGFYAIASQQVWKPRSIDAGNQVGITVFAQYSHANPDVSPVSDHVGIGISASGLIAARANDGMGIYWSWAGLSRSGGAGFDENESSLEGYYQCQATPFFAIKPDVQWIRHPGGQSSPNAAIVFTLRLIIEF